MPKTTFSNAGPFKGKIIDAKPVDSTYIELIIEGPGGKKYKRMTGKSSELLRRALQQKDPWVSFTLNERGEVTMVTKRQYRASEIK
ncbi:hypothetical protein KY325_02350 [Candidatus Woesearchaeota archaeon]|nr:hypothetical protein [Candidatus Woesearchaeota archaeon]MBW3017975.1 hypothetical protein [Candidatus Woesearchaeota archaeon]